MVPSTETISKQTVEDPPQESNKTLTVADTFPGLERDEQRIDYEIERKEAQRKLEAKLSQQGNDSGSGGGALNYEGCNKQLCFLWCA